MGAQKIDDSIRLFHKQDDVSGNGHIPTFRPMSCIGASLVSSLSTSGILCPSLHRSGRTSHMEPSRILVPAPEIPMTYLQSRTAFVGPSCAAPSQSNRTSSWPHRATLTMIFDPNQHPLHLLLDRFVDAGMLLDPLEEARPKGGDTNFVVLQLGEQSGVDVGGFAAAEEEGGGIVGLRVVGGRDGAGRRGGEEGEGKR